MKRFMEHCQTLGLEQTVLNGSKLLNGINAGIGECGLFFICGYDFVFNPSERKFWGIEHIFVQRGAPLALNLSPSFPAKFAGALKGQGAYVQPPRLGGNRPNLVAGGLREGGVGNYNLMGRALDLLVTDPDGMDYNQGLTSVIPNLKAAFAKPSPRLGEHGRAELELMRSVVRPYWGGDTWRLGL